MRGTNQGAGGGGGGVLIGGTSRGVKGGDALIDTGESAPAYGGNGYGAGGAGGWNNPGRNGGRGVIYIEW